MVAQLRATDKRAAGTVDDRDMGHGHMENKNDRTSGGMEVCVLDDEHHEWLDEPGQKPQGQED